MSIHPLKSDVLRIFKARYLRRNPDEAIAESSEDLFSRKVRIYVRHRIMLNLEDLSSRIRQILMLRQNYEGITFYGSKVP
jgi:hypothetical protein